MATAFVPGVWLRDAVARHGPLPEEALRTLPAGIAEDLVHVHAAGLLHRDLAPANVMLALDGPHVIDFGISPPSGDGAGNALRMRDPAGVGVRCRGDRACCSWDPRPPAAVPTARARVCGGPVRLPGGGRAHGGRP